MSESKRKKKCCGGGVENIVAKNVYGIWTRGSMQLSSSNPVFSSFPLAMF
jgi:hypothetical protein